MKQPRQQKMETIVFVNFRDLLVKYKASFFGRSPFAGDVNCARFNKKVAPSQALRVSRRWLDARPASFAHAPARCRAGVQKKAG
jgi:hypothetical protein